MRLVLAHRAGEALTAVRALSAEEHTALVRHYREGHEEPWFRGWLAHLLQLHLWIACDCRSAHNPPPLLFVRAGAREQALLVRMPDRPPHARGCHFASPPALAGAADTPIGLSPLAQLLYRWVGAARLNIVFPYEAEDALSQQYAALREVSKSLDLAPGRRLYDFSRTHPQGLPELFRRLVRAAAAVPGETRAEGLYLTVTSSLGRIELPAISGREPETLAEAPAVEQLMGTSRDAGPYVLLIELAAHPPGGVRVQRVLAQPVYSRGLLVPVQGAQERRTLRVLLDVQRALLSGHHRLISIRKTLPDAPFCDRGIAFQVQQLGPNGRAARTLDILSVDAGRAHQENVLLESESEILYHRVGPTEGALSSTDQGFRRRLIAQLTRGREPRLPGSARHVAPRSPPERAVRSCRWIDSG